MNKYYTPDISEFFVGFEYEYLSEDDTNEWNRGYFGEDISDSDDWNFEWNYNRYQSKNIRVKYLDKQDIEGLGFLCTGESDNGVEKEFQLYIDEKLSILVEMSFNREITITSEKLMDVPTERGNTLCRELFCGTIKNKSELKKLLKQLNIN